MARPVKRLVTTRSVVAARAATPEAATSSARSSATPAPASSAIAAIRGRRPYLSCRCAVIVGADKIESAGLDRDLTETCMDFGDLDFGTLGRRLAPCCWRQVKAAAGIQMG